jgi:hypothetical protein
MNKKSLIFYLYKTKIIQIKIKKILKKKERSKISLLKNDFYKSTTQILNHGIEKKQ